jgi:hypothetical protein
MCVSAGSEGAETMTTMAQRNDADNSSVMRTSDALTAPAPNGVVTHNGASPNGARRGKLGAAAGLKLVRANGSPMDESQLEAGVEVRVHGIGDHATYSALGTPDYKELVDSRVWIGRVPCLPGHKLRLVNWSRANRKLTRHLTWYLAFPFTLLNVAGYMEPADKVRRYAMRVGIGVASICLTVAMASWITIILETAWREVTDVDDRLTGIVLQAVGPGLLIVFILYRMVVGRALVDRGGAVISVLSIAALLCLIWYLHTQPADRTKGPLHDLLVGPDENNAIDAMTTIVVGTTAVVWLVAMVLCITAIRKRRAGAGFAGAAALLVIAVTLMHAGGSMLRLFTASVFSILPGGDKQVVHSAPSMPNHTEPLKHVLLPKADDLLGSKQYVVTTIGEALRIDLIPVYFLVMVIVFGGLMWLELWCGRWKQNTRDSTGSGWGAGSGLEKKTKCESKTHLLVQRLPENLPQAVLTAVAATAAAWVLITFGFLSAPGWMIDDWLLVLKILGAAAIVMVVLRRPQTLAERLRGTFGSVADIAGFWAPDLHPLAGASYRRGLVAGIRQAINDVVLQYPDDPIALVGHSQGSVVCAWFVRGGHWTESPSEGMTDREALRSGVYTVKGVPSNRIALFTVGSPLQSLYATFFPRYFDDDFFESTREMTCQGARWRNYWRKTDPIGSALDGLPEDDNVNVTELKDQKTLGHGEYWSERRLRDDITRFFKATRGKTRKKLASASR